MSYLKGVAEVGWLLNPNGQYCADDDGYGMAYDKEITIYGSIKEDCMRRDLTINSLFQNVSTGEMLDITGHSLDDIRDHVIRTPANPFITYDDELLRILRSIRFASRYGWDIEKKTWEGINVPRLAIITREKVRDELCKMLASPYPVMAMDQLKKSGAHSIGRNLKLEVFDG